MKDFLGCILTKIVSLAYSNGVGDILIRPMERAKL